MSPEWGELQTVLGERVAELREEAPRIRDPEPTADAIASLMTLAQALLPALTARRLPSPSVFLREGGNLELVVQSPLIARRLTVHLSGDGRDYQAYLGDSRGVVEGPLRVSSTDNIPQTWTDWLT